MTTDDKSVSDLLPCPFCGAKAYVVGYGPYRINCKACDASLGPIFCAERNQAIAAWNVRSHPSGYRLVPVEPTEAMLSAGAARARDFMSEHGPYPRTKSVYRAMIQAAPKEGK